MTVLQGFSKPPQLGHVALLSRKADMLRTSEFQHQVQYIHRDANLGRLTPICAGSQAAADHPFEAADIGLNQGTPVVA